MKHLKLLETESEMLLKSESPIYKEVEKAFMRVLIKGTGINPDHIKSVDSYNKL